MQPASKLAGQKHLLLCLLIFVTISVVAPLLLLFVVLLSYCLALLVIHNLFRFTADDRSYSLLSYFITLLPLLPCYFFAGNPNQPDTACQQAGRTAGPVWVGVPAAAPG